MKFRLPAILLALLMVLACFAACGETDKPADASSEAATSVPATAESSIADNSDEVSEASSEVDEFYDGLPERDFGGRDFTILQRTEYKYEFVEDELATEKINTLISERNSSVEARFGVKIKTVEQAGAWGVHEDFMSYIRNTVDSGLATYDLIAGYAAIMPSIVSDGYFINWYEMDEYINFEKDWWSQDFISEMSLGGNLYMLAGDISITFWEAMQCMFFNKGLAERYQLTDLYTTVRDGNWTFDEMLRIIKETYNETTDEADRIYGYTTALTTQVDIYQDAFNIPVTEKNADGKPHFTINQEKTYKALEKVYDLIVDKQYTKITTDEGGVEGSVKVFGEGRALFAPLWLGAGASLRNYDQVYGILPMPKYDVAQETYNSTCSDFYSVFAVPLTAADSLDFVGIITEALCVESAKSVVPQYYTLVLKERYTNDDDSREMIEKVREGILCNFGYLYSYTLDWPAHQLNICINAKNKDFASTWATNESKFEANLAEVLAFYFEE